MTRDRAWLALVVAGVAALAWCIARTAWMSDDAYVTLRSIDHLVHGRGFTYNAVERVQAYTHPLWALLLVPFYAVTGDAWRMPMALGALATLAGVGVLVRGAATRAGAAVGVAALVASKAFVDWATSGLENPLEDLLLASFALVLLRGDRPNVALLGALVGLLGVTRLDAMLLVLPALAIVAVGLARRGDRAVLRAAALGLAPLVAWHGFALAYYGSPWPNTAYAKLGTGIPAADLAAQGYRWLAWNAWNDPTTLPTILAGVVAGLALRDLRALGLVVGVGLHLAYVVAIGGDFMAGRFLVAPLVVAVALLGQASWRAPVALVAVAALIGGSLWSPQAPLRSGPQYVRAQAYDGVVDERGYYWRGTGWWTPRENPGPNHEFVRDGRAAKGPIAVKSVIGLYGFYAGPDHHVVDRLGLADPLLARLPAVEDPEWRIGHFRRRVPDDYVRSVLARNEVEDPELHALYDLVRRTTRGPLWTRKRWRAIWKLNTGGYALDRERWRHPAR